MTCSLPATIESPTRNYIVELIELDAMISTISVTKLGEEKSVAFSVSTTVDGDQHQWVAKQTYVSTRELQINFFISPTRVSMGRKGTRQNDVFGLLVCRCFKPVGLCQIDTDVPVDPGACINCGHFLRAIRPFDQNGRFEESVE